MTENSQASAGPATVSRATANVYETPGGEAYVVEIPVPGLTRQEVVVEADVHTLTVRTQPVPAAREQERNYLQREHIVEPVSRVIEFPAEIDTDNVRVTLERGVLRIKAPKALAASPKVVRVTPEG